MGGMRALHLAWEYAVMALVLVLRVAAGVAVLLLVALVTDVIFGTPWP